MTDPLDDAWAGIAPMFGQPPPPGPVRASAARVVLAAIAQVIALLISLTVILALVAVLVTAAAFALIVWWGLA